MSFGIADEVYAATISNEGYLMPAYTYGIMLLALPSWCTGTALGIMIGNILPSSIVAALSVALYGMFLAIIIPPAKKDKIVGVVVIISFLLSYLASVLPLVRGLSESLRTIILTILISVVAALLFPRRVSDEH